MLIYNNNGSCVQFQNSMLYVNVKRLINRLFRGRWMLQANLNTLYVDYDWFVNNRLLHYSCTIIHKNC